MPKIDYRLTVLPLAYGAALLIMQAVATPYWLWTNIDPSYFYLFNGLEVALGQTPADYHHPGTTTQLLAGLVLRLMHPFADAGALTDATLGRPEFALHVLATVNTGLIVAAMVWAGAEAKRTFGSLSVPVLLVQATPFLSTVNLVNGYTVKPEATLLALGMVFIGLLCRALRAEGGVPSLALSGLSGLVAGGLFITKLHALSMGFAPLFLLRRWSNRGAYGVGGLIAVLLFVVVMWSYLPTMLDYFHGVALHQGAYGQGAAGILPDHYLWNAVKQLRRPIFSVPMVLGLLVLGLRRKDLAPAEGPQARLLAGLILGQIVHLAIVAKNPISYYLIPAFLTMGLSAALTLTLGRKLIPVSDRRWDLALKCLAGLLVVTQSLTIVQAMGNRMREKATSLAVDMTPFGACTKVNFDFSSDPSFAMGLGNWMADYRFSGWLERHMPANTYIWIPVLGLPSHWDEPLIAIDELVERAPCTVFRGAWGLQIWNELERALPGRPIDACSNGDEWVLSTGIACAGAFPGRQSKALK